MGVSNPVSTESAVVRFDSALFSAEVILKACYWLSRDFLCEVEVEQTGSIRVTVTRRQSSSAESIPDAIEQLRQMVSDFALREKIESKTSGIRDLLLAKAFSEAGLLEDPPSGVFGDKVEEEKPQGMFKILNNSAS